MKHNFLHIIIGVLALATIFSCKKERPSMVYFPDMYYPVAYDPLQEATLAYSDSDYKNTVPQFASHYGRTALNVDERTVYRNEDGLVETDWENLPDESYYNQNYDQAVQVTASPLNPANRAEDLKRGKQLFEKTCVVCHGDLGNGKGPIVESGAYTGVPDYKDRAITVGSVYYVIKNGRNMMGSYSGQLEMGDRWRVAEYVINEFKK